MTATAPMTAEAAPIGGRVRRGILWKTLSQIVDQGSRTVMSLILARLLTPREFGVAGMAFVFVGIALIFTDLSLGAALVQRLSITDRDRSTVFWMTTASGIAIAGTSFAAAPLVASFFNEPQVTSLFRAISLTFAVTAVCATQASLLTRELAFRALELRVMLSGVARAAVAVCLAFLGAGAWSIVGGALAASFTSLVMLWTASPWRPSFTFSLESLRVLGPFGAKSFLTRMLTYAIDNLDNLLIGRFIGASALGIYSLAYNAMLSPLTRVVTPVVQVLFPAISRMQTEEQRLVTAWLRASAATAAVVVPAFAGLIILGPDVVRLLFGPRWEPAIRVLQVLCIGGALDSLQGLNLSVLQARNRAGAVLVFRVWAAAANVAAFVIGLHWGILGVATGFAAVRVILMPANVTMTCRIAGVRVTTYLRSFANVALGTALMAASVVFIRSQILHGAPLMARVPLLAADGALVFAGTLLLRRDPIIEQIRRLRSA